MRHQGHLHHSPCKAHWPPGAVLRFIARFESSYWSFGLPKIAAPGPRKRAFGCCDLLKAQSHSFPCALTAAARPNHVQSA